jgi:acyl-CoA thioester hydrolase
MDSYGHVNNLLYLRWCETGRVDYFLKIGFWPELPPKGLGPILASITCDFRRPLTYPDSVWIGTRVSRIGNSSLQMDHVVVSRDLGVVAAEVKSTLVMLDYSVMKSVRVPDEMRNAIARVEARCGPVPAARSTP